MRPDNKPCPGCGVEPGQPHVDGCGVARCTLCGWQRLLCDEHRDDPRGAGEIWTGLWPGVVECREFGLWVTLTSVMHPNNRPFVKCSADDPDRTEDLNELGMMAARGEVEWDGKRWVRAGRQA